MNIQIFTQNPPMKSLFSENKAFHKKKKKKKKKHSLKTNFNSYLIINQLTLNGK